MVLGPIGGFERVIRFDQFVPGGFVFRKSRNISTTDLPGRAGKDSASSQFPRRKAHDLLAILAEAEPELELGNWVDVTFDHRPADGQEGTACIVVAKSCAQTVESWRQIPGGLSLSLKQGYETKD